MAPERLMWTVLDEIDQAAADDDPSLAVSAATSRPGRRAANDGCWLQHEPPRPSPGTAQIVRRCSSTGRGRDTDGAGAALDTDLRWQPALPRVRASIGGPGPGERLEGCAATSLVDRATSSALPVVGARADAADRGRAGRARVAGLES